MIIFNFLNAKQDLLINMYEEEYCSTNEYLKISACLNAEIRRQKSSTGVSLPCGFFLVFRR